MTTDFRVRRTFPRSTEELATALNDPEYHDAKVRYVGGPGSGLLRSGHDEESDEFTVVVDQRVLHSELPSIARRFAGRDLRARREEWWTLSSFYCTGEFEVRVPGAPMRAGGSMSAVGTDDGCRLTVRAYISVRAPLIGRTIERSMIDTLHDWLDDEYDFTLRWLEGDRPA